MKSRRCEGISRARETETESNRNMTVARVCSKRIRDTAIKYFSKSQDAMTVFIYIAYRRSDFPIFGFYQRSRGEFDRISNEIA